MSDSETVRPMFCSSCGHPRTSDAMFCEKCGLHFDSLVAKSNLTEAPATPLVAPLRSASVPRSRRIYRICGPSVVLLVVCAGLVFLTTRTKGSKTHFEPAAQNTVTETPTAQGPPSSTNVASTLARYAGKMPDQAFWADLRPLFSDTILGGGRSGSEVFGEFYADQDMYIFTPCEYDENTKTITVTWKSKTPEPSEEGCTNCQFLGSHAVSIDIGKPENGIVATSSSSADANPSINLLSKGMASIDASSVKTHSFNSLPPALAKWVMAFINDTQHPVEIAVTVIE